MKAFCGLLLFFLLAVSCKKSNQEPDISGNYAGTFTLFLGAHDSSAAISINFSGGLFSGQSADLHFPTVCEGSYTIIGDTISFANDCAESLDYLNATTLAGNYMLTVSGDTVIFTRGYNNYAYEADLYELKKQ